MKYAWRGVVDEDGDVVAWPMLLWDHNAAFTAMPHLAVESRARWRQWNPGEPPDFDPGASAEDQQAVRTWLAALSEEGR